MEDDRGHASATFWWEQGRNDNMTIDIQQRTTLAANWQGKNKQQLGASGDNLLFLIGE